MIVSERDLNSAINALDPIISQMLTTIDNDSDIMSPEYKAMIEVMACQNVLRDILTGKGPAETISEELVDLLGRDPKSWTGHFEPKGK